MSIFLVSKDNLWSNGLHSKLEKDFDCRFYSDDSYRDALARDNPDWIFFLHWSSFVPAEIYENYRCVVIHTSNLPHGRGGSPLQNQILEGINESRVNALVMGEQLDAGAIYCSLPITLQGSLVDIWLSIADQAFHLIQNCVEHSPTPIEQQGDVHVYKRNKNNILPLEAEDDIVNIHKFIQMLDAEGYPSAFYDIGGFRLEFSRSKLNDSGSLISDVTIKRIG
tara:strand:+ start:857 stop:1525 length:669 start_codon:yes stop_codon:yes gene_type:complete